MLRIKLHFRKFAFFYAGIFTAITIALSIMPGRQLESAGLIDIPHLDKIGHLVAYSIVSFFWVLTLRSLQGYVWKSSLLVLSIGLCMEMIQFYFLEGRYFEIFDIIANISGILIGLVLYKFLYKDEAV